MKNDDNFGLISANSGDINTIRKNYFRQSLIMEKKIKLYNSYYKSKWSNLKFFIQDNISLKTSISLLKTKTIEQFSSKCIEIYKKKLEIQLITQKNREMFTSLQFNYNNNIDNNLCVETSLSNDEILSQLTIKDIKEEDNFQSNEQTIKDFFFKFREDNILMMRLIE